MPCFREYSQADRDDYRNYSAKVLRKEVNYLIRVREAYACNDHACII